MNNRQWKKLEAERHNKAYLESKKLKPEKVRKKKSSKKVAAIMATIAGLGIQMY